MWPFPNSTKILLFHILTNRPLTILTQFETFLTPPKGPVRKMTFCETLISMKGNSLYFQINLFLTLFVWYPLCREYSSPFTKMEDAMKQSDLLPLEILPPRVQYDFLFQHLPSLSLRESDRGRPPFPRDVLLKAFI